MGFFSLANHLGDGCKSGVDQDLKDAIYEGIYRCAGETGLLESVHFRKVLFAENQVLKVVFVDLLGGKESRGTGNAVFGALEEVFRVVNRLLGKFPEQSFGQCLALLERGLEDCVGIDRHGCRGLLGFRLAAL